MFSLDIHSQVKTILFLGVVTETFPSNPQPPIIQPPHRRPQPTQNLVRRGGILTMHTLPIRPLYLSVKHGVLVPGQHLLLPRHVLQPPLQPLGLLLARLLERLGQRLHHAVDGAQAHAMAPLLMLGHAAGDLPEQTTAEDGGRMERAEAEHYYFILFPVFWAACLAKLLYGGA